MMPTTAPALTVRDLANFLNVDAKTIYRLAQKGELPGFKVAGAWRFQRTVIDAWIEARTANPTSKAHAVSADLQEVDFRMPSRSSFEVTDQVGRKK